MKKSISENEGDTLVVEEFPKQSQKKRAFEASHDVYAGRSIEDELAKRKALLKNIYKGSNNPYLKDSVADISQTFPVADLLIFQLNDDHTTVKTDWATLPLRLQEVFEEIMYSLPVSGVSNPDDDGCYTFSYADDEYNLSVISIVIEGKAALFYKNIDSSEN